MVSNTFFSNMMSIYIYCVNGIDEHNDETQIPQICSHELSFVCSLICYEFIELKKKSHFLNISGIKKKRQKYKKITE